MDCGKSYLLGPLEKVVWILVYHSCRVHKQGFDHTAMRVTRKTVWCCFQSAMHTAVLAQYGAKLCNQVIQYLEPLRCNTATTDGREILELFDHRDEKGGARHPNH